MNYFLNILLICLFCHYSKGCPLYEYRDVTCKPCHSTCKKCNGPSQGHCTFCNSSYTLCRKDHGNFCMAYKDCYPATTRTSPITTLSITTSTSATPIPTLSPTTQSTIQATQTLIEDVLIGKSLSFYIIIAIFCVTLAVIGFLIGQFICTRYKFNIIKRKELSSYSKTVEIETKSIFEGETKDKTEKIKNEANAANNTSKRKADQSLVVIGEFAIENFASEKLDWKKRIRISGGAFGDVYKCTYRDSEGSYYVAVKEPKEDSKEAFREREHMSQAKDHPHIIQLITTMIGDNMFLVMPLRKSNLSEFLEKTNGITITNKIRYCQQIAHGMSYLMHKRILHCDLKASNILVVDKNYVQISDFGKSQKMNSRKRSVGTITHTAIEILDAFNKVENSEATDIWSFGVTIWEIFNVIKREPYADSLGKFTEAMLISHLKSKKHLHINFWPSTSDSPVLDEIATYMFKCWCHIQNERPTFNFMWGFFSSKLPECNVRLFNLSENSSTNSKSLFK